MNLLEILATTFSAALVLGTLAFLYRKAQEPKKAPVVLKRK